MGHFKKNEEAQAELIQFLYKSLSLIMREAAVLFKCYRIIMLIMENNVYH